MNWKYSVFSVAVVITVLLGRSEASAQLTTGTLVGTVTDQSGAKVPEATVTLTNLDTHFTKVLTTQNTGDYRADLLPIGHYTVDVEAHGFKKFEQRDIDVAANQQARLDAQLQIGSATQDVTVSAAPPAINLENATVGRTFSTEELEDLPLVDRNIYSSLTLVPGVQNVSVGNTLGFPQTVVQINGSMTENNTGAVSYYLDGGLDMTGVRMTGNQLPNPEALAQFDVQTSNYSAVFGRMSSGVVNAVTKSGTNQFHGSVYEFHRETNFNSNVWHGGRSPVHRNFFGGVLGGPIKRDRTFFFFDYSGFRDIAPKNFTGSAILPTAQELKGDFSQFLPTNSGTITSCNQTLSATDTAAGHFILCNPKTRTPYSANVITDPLDKVALNIVAALPAPNAGTALAPSYVGSIGLPSHYNEYMGKIDHQLGSKQRLFGSYFYLNGLNTVFPGSGNVPWSLQAQQYLLHEVNLSDTISLAPNKVNQVWLTYTRSFGSRVNTPGKSLTDFGSKFAIQGMPSLPQITVTNYFSLTNAISGPNAGTNFYSFRDLYIWTRGRHTLQIGGEASLNKDVQPTLLNNYGVWGFVASKTARTGNALGDFLLGMANSQTQDAPVTGATNSFFYSLFVQDDWRMTPHFTVNAGLRWDIQTPPTDPGNKETTFIQGRQSTINPLMPTGELVAGDPGVTRGIVPLRLHHISPRLGFAWDPFGNGTTSVRAAGGVFYGGVSGNEWNTTSNYYPFTLRYTFGVPGTLTNPYLNTPSPFPFSYTPGQVKPAPAGSSIAGIAPNFQWPYTYQVTSSVQQQLARDTAVAITFVGAYSHNLVFQMDKNYPIFNAAAPALNTTANVNARRPIDTGVLGSIYALESIGRVGFNAMEVTLKRQLTHGLAVNMFYTWSKTLATLGIDASGGSAEDYNNLALEKGPTSTDERNKFAATIVWKPNYVKQHGFAGWVANGWTITPIIHLDSGSPFTITPGVDANNDGNTADRANQIGNPYDPTISHSSRQREIHRWFNTAAFCAYSVANPAACPGTGPAGSDGTSQRNGYYGPGSKIVDLAVLRDFRFTEEMDFQLRGESTNVLNMVNLNNPNGAINISPAANQITSAGSMRQIQVGARLTF